MVYFFFDELNLSMQRELNALPMHEQSYYPHNIHHIHFQLEKCVTSFQTPTQLIGFVIKCTLGWCDYFNHSSLCFQTISLLTCIHSATQELMVKYRSYTVNFTSMTMDNAHASNHSIYCHLVNVHHTSHHLFLTQTVSLNWIQIQ